MRETRFVIVVIGLLLACAAGADTDQGYADARDESSSAGAVVPAAAPGAWTTTLDLDYVQTMFNDDAIWVRLTTKYVLPTSFVNRDPSTGFSNCSPLKDAPFYFRASKASFPAGSGLWSEMRSGLIAAAMTGAPVQLRIEDRCDNGYITVLGVIYQVPR